MFFISVIRGYPMENSNVNRVKIIVKLAKYVSRINKTNQKHREAELLIDTRHIVNMPTPHQERKNKTIIKIPIKRKTLYSKRKYKNNTLPHALKKSLRN